MKLKKLVLHILSALIVIIVISILALLIISSVGFNRPPPIPLHDPAEDPATVWYDKNNDFVLVSDSEGNYFGLVGNDETILWVDFQFEKGHYLENEVSFYSTGEKNLKAAVCAVENPEEIRKVGVGNVWIHSWKQSELGIYCDVEQISANGELDFDRVIQLTDEFIYREAETWPPEMLQWLEQREQSK